MIYGRFFSGRLVFLSRRCKIGGEWYASDSSDPVVVAWRTENGWMPIVQDTMICSPGFFACDAGVEEEDGAIHKRVTAKSIEDATLVELKRAARCGNLDVSAMTSSQKSELLQKLLK